MKIAYLISAHTDPQQLKRLIKALKGNDVYVHIDKKVSQEPFECALHDENVIFVKNRVRCNWGGIHNVAINMN